MSGNNDVWRTSVWAEKKKKEKGGSGCIEEGFHPGEDNRNRRLQKKKKKNIS